MVALEIPNLDMFHGLATVPIQSVDFSSLKDVVLSDAFLVIGISELNDIDAWRQRLEGKHVSRLAFVINREFRDVSSPIEDLKSKLSGAWKDSNFPVQVLQLGAGKHSIQCFLLIINLTACAFSSCSYDALQHELGPSNNN